LQAKLEKAQAKHNESVRTLEEKKMKIESAQKAIQEHKSRLQDKEQKLAQAQHKKAVGENERHRHKEALLSQSVSNTTNTPNTASNIAHNISQPDHQAPAVGAH